METGGGGSGAAHWAWAWTAAPWSFRAGPAVQPVLSAAQTLRNHSPSFLLIPTFGAKRNALNPCRACRNSVSRRGPSSPAVPPSRTAAIGRHGPFCQPLVSTEKSGTHQAVSTWTLCSWTLTNSRW